MAVNEEQLLRQFQTSGSRETLRELLIAHQDRIYNACFQVLGRAEDAEDAAQEALLKLAEGARSARDADAFRGWIYRVSFRSALDLWRRREATRNRESRAAMNRPSTPPLDDRERVALFEAMDGLDDRDRSLLLEHYFEKAPLADLGERRGVSAVAIWKRIDRAREKLKKTLLGSGFVVATSRVSEALEATVPATAPATLVGEAILGKILAGGLAVGATKSSVIPAVVIALVLLFGIFTGGYVMFRSREPGKLPTPGQARASKPAAPSAAPVVALHSGASSPSPVEPAPKKVLRETLERYRAWHAEYKAMLKTEIPADNPFRNLDFRNEGWKRFQEARQQVFEDPETFLEFIKDPANEELLDTLVGDVLDKMSMHGRGIGRHAQFYKEFPPEFMRQILDLAKTGRQPLRKGLLGFLGQVHDVPPEFDELYLGLIYDPEPSIQAAALDALWRRRELDLTMLEKVRERFDSSSDMFVRTTAILAISYSPRPEPLAWMLDRMETVHDGFLTVLVAEAAVRMMMKGTPDSRTLDRVSKGLVATIGDKDFEWAQFRLIPAALELPVSHSVTILESVLPKVTDPKLKNAVTQVLEQGRKESASPRELQSLFHQATLER